jgi:hypothetical protein
VVGILVVSPQSAPCFLHHHLSKLPQKRARIYHSFFGDLNWDELVPVSKPSSIVQREEKQEKQNLLAKRLGMNRS